MRWLPFFLLLAGCSPDFITKHGAAFHIPEGVEYDLSIANIQEDFLLKHIAPQDRTAYAAAIYGLNVNVVAEPFSCFGADIDGVEGAFTCAGITHTTDMTVWWGPCNIMSAYPHELLHWTKGVVTGDTDYYHKDPLFDVLNNGPGVCDGTTSGDPL